MSNTLSIKNFAAAAGNKWLEMYVDPIKLMSEWQQGEQGQRLLSDPNYVAKKNNRDRDIGKFRPLGRHIIAKRPRNSPGQPHPLDGGIAPNRFRAGKNNYRH